MNYLSVEFYGMLLICVTAYYFFPIKTRWIVLLAGSMLFYYSISAKALGVLLLMCLFSYMAGIVFEKKKSKALLTSAIIILLMPMICVRIWTRMQRNKGIFVIAGLSYFTLQAIAYIIDVYKRKVPAQKDFFKYILFISFFPQILQGPIPRYEQLQEQLIKGHKFEEKEFIKGGMLILWGFFLKMMLADKAAAIVNTIFENYKIYTGTYVIFGGGTIFTTDLCGFSGMHYDCAGNSGSFWNQIDR